LDVVAEEARKAKQAASLDLQERDRKLTEMQESMAVLTNKLTEAQLQQAEFLAMRRTPMLRQARRQSSAGFSCQLMRSVPQTDWIPLSLQKWTAPPPAV
jgi:hypothetical protein